MGVKNIRAGNAQISHLEFFLLGIELKEVCCKCVAGKAESCPHDGLSDSALSGTKSGVSQCQSHFIFSNHYIKEPIQREIYDIYMHIFISLI